MKKQRKIKVEKQRKIAKERVERLLDLASSASQKLADRYVTLARKISMKVNLRLPSSLKRKFCRNCGTYFRPGVNCRVRTRNGKIVYYCFNCRKTYRIPFLKEKIISEPDSPS
ncbi:MAG: ribonuclease P [archaeon]